MIYGYARVSTIGQEKDGNSLTDQESKLRENGATVIYKEAYTGTKIDRPLFNELISKLQSGDTLVVTKLDRFSRTACDGAAMIKQLRGRGVNVHIINMGVVDGTPMGNLMMNILLSFAEFERDMIVQRTAEGKAIARQKPDYREGRKRIEVDFGSYPERVQSGEISVMTACRELGISKQTWYNRMKEMVA